MKSSLQQPSKVERRSDQRIAGSPGKAVLTDRRVAGLKVKDDRLEN